MGPMRRQNSKKFRIFSRSSLFCFNFIYLLIGALIFRYLESRIETSEREIIEKQKNLSLKQLWLITEKLNVLYRNDWIQEAEQWLEEYEKNLLKLTATMQYKQQIFKNSDHRWTFAGSFYYCFTLLTTIGGNNCSPKTIEGKIFTIIYSSFGIPLMFLVLSNCGLITKNILSSFFSIFGIGENIRVTRTEKKKTVVELGKNGKGLITTKLLANEEKIQIKYNGNSNSKNGYENFNYRDEKIYAIEENLTMRKNMKLINYLLLMVTIILSVAHILVSGYVLSICSKKKSFFETVCFCLAAMITLESGDLCKLHFCIIEREEQQNAFWNQIYFLYLCLSIYCGLILLSVLFLILNNNNNKPSKSNNNSSLMSYLQQNVQL